MATMTMQYTGVLVIETCCNCSIQYAMPKDLQERALRDHSVSFFCPRGHGQSYTGETAEQRLTRQLNAERTSKTWYADQLKATERSKSALKGQLTKARNKIAAGNCPVPDCGQHFANVREHMKFKHPDYTLTDPETGNPVLP